MGRVSICLAACVVAHVAGTASTAVSLPQPISETYKAVRIFDGYVFTTSLELPLHNVGSPKIKMKKHPFVTSIETVAGRLVIKGLPLRDQRQILSLKTNLTDGSTRYVRIYFVPEERKKMVRGCRLVPIAGIDFGKDEILDRIEIVDFIETLSKTLNHPTGWIKATNDVPHGNAEKLVSGLRILLMSPGPCDGKGSATRNSMQAVENLFELHETGKLQRSAPFGHRIDTVYAIGTEEINRPDRSDENRSLESAYRMDSTDKPIQIVTDLIEETSTQHLRNERKSAEYTSTVEPSTTTSTTTVVPSTMTSTTTTVKPSTTTSTTTTVEPSTTTSTTTTVKPSTTTTTSTTTTVKPSTTTTTVKPSTTTSTTTTVKPSTTTTTSTTTTVEPSTTTSTTTTVKPSTTTTTVKPSTTTTTVKPSTTTSTTTTVKPSTTTSTTTTVKPSTTTTTVKPSTTTVKPSTTTTTTTVKPSTTTSTTTTTTTVVPSTTTTELSTTARSNRESEHYTVTPQHSVVKFTTDDEVHREDKPDIPQGSVDETAHHSLVIPIVVISTMLIIGVSLILIITLRRRASEYYHLHRVSEEGRVHGVVAAL